MVLRALNWSVACLFVLQIGGLKHPALPSPTATLAAMAFLWAARWAISSGPRSTADRLLTLARRHAFAIAVAVIVSTYLAIQLPGLGLRLGHAPLDIDEHRLADRVSTFFRDGTVPHRTVAVNRPGFSGDRFS